MAALLLESYYLPDADFNRKLGFTSFSDGANFSTSYAKRVEKVGAEGADEI